MTLQTNEPFPVPQESVEAGLLASIAGDMAKWIELTTFSSEDFVAHRAVFQWMGQYLAQYGNLPSNSLLNTKFDLHAPIGDYQYWVSEMRRYTMARQILQTMQQGYEQITEPDKALDFLLNKLGTIRSEQTNHIQATDSSALERLEKFDMRTQYIYKAQKMYGMRTGIKIIDESLIGWTPGNLVVAYARPSLGKTWWLMWQGMNAWLDGHTVLAIAPEMPANALNLRVDMLAGAALDHVIDYTMLQQGNPVIRDNYEFILNVMSQSQRWWTYSSVETTSFGVDEIASLIRQHNPQIVLIDGISLLRPSRRGQAWEEMRELSYGIKNLATRYEVPVIVTHQSSNIDKGAKPSTMGRGDSFKMPTLSDAAFGDAIIGAASDILTFCAEPTSNDIIWYSIRKYRERGFKREMPERMAIAKNFGRGKIFDIGHLGYDPEKCGDEARRLLGYDNKYSIQNMGAPLPI